MSYYLSLEETAEPDDEKVEAHGVTFVADPWSRRYVDGMVIDVREFWGRANLVAHNPAFGEGCS